MKWKKIWSKLQVLRKKRTKISREMSLKTQILVKTPSSEGKKRIKLPWERRWETLVLAPDQTSHFLQRTCFLPSKGITKYKRTIFFTNAFLLPQKLYCRLWYNSPAETTTVTYARSNTNDSFASSPNLKHTPSSSRDQVPQTSSLKVYHYHPPK